MLKRLFSLFALAVLLAPFAASTQAQQLKVGYTDHEIIIVNMPDYQRVQQQLQQAFQKNQQDLQGMAQGFQEQVERYQKQQALLSDQRRQEREQELIQMQAQLQQQEQEMQQNLGQQEQQLMAPLLQRVQDAIDAVAADKGLDIVLRSQAGGQPLILFVNEDRVVNITLDVARRLGLDVTEEDTASN